MNRNLSILSWAALLFAVLVIIIAVMERIGVDGIFLDLGNAGDSKVLALIATTNDSNGIFTREAAVNKLLIDASKNWPVSDALANGSSCDSGAAATSWGVTGSLTCSPFAVGAHTTDTGPSPDCSGTATYQDGEGGCDTLDGVEDFETATDDAVLVGTGTVFDSIGIGDCDDSDGNHLNYDTGANSFSCGTSSSVTDTGPSPDCSGTNVYQDGDANCDTLNMFATFSTSGESDIVADSNADTLTIAVSGNGVSALFNAGSDTFTIEVAPRAFYVAKAAVVVCPNDVSTAMDCEDFRLYNPFSLAGVIQDAICSVGAAPTTDTVIVDINVDGTTIYTTQGNRPTIAVGGFTSGATVAPDVTTFGPSSYISIDIDAEDTGNTAFDLTCSVNIRFQLVYDNS